MLYPGCESAGWLQARPVWNRWDLADYHGAECSFWWSWELSLGRRLHLVSIFHYGLMFSWLISFSFTPVGFPTQAYKFTLDPAGKPVFVYFGQTQVASAGRVGVGIPTIT